MSSVDPIVLLLIGVIFVQSGVTIYVAAMWGKSSERYLQFLSLVSQREIPALPQTGPPPIINEETRKAIDREKQLKDFDKLYMSGVGTDAEANAWVNDGKPKG